MTDKVDFTGVQWKSVEWTNLCLLYLRAHESSLKQPILGDQLAVVSEVPVRRTDFCGEMEFR